MIIDTHAHVVPSSLIETLRTERRSFPSIRLLPEAGSVRMAFVGEAATRPIAPRLSDLDQRREWLTSARVDHQAVGGWTDVYGYELPCKEGADWARCFNEHLMNDAAALPALTPLATVPLQDGALAARVLEEALDNGLAARLIGTQPKGWAGISTIPSSTRSGRSPRRAYVLGRLRRNQAIHTGYPDPLDGFRRLYFDTVLFDPRSLRFLCDVAGADRVVLGSDYPFPIGDPEPRRIIDETSPRRAILGETAARIFHIDCGCHDDR
jgi:hypothetical protein